MAPVSTTSGSWLEPGTEGGEDDFYRSYVIPIVRLVVGVFLRVLRVCSPRTPTLLGNGQFTCTFPKLKSRIHVIVTEG